MGKSHSLRRSLEANADDATVGMCMSSIDIRYQWYTNVMRRRAGIRSPQVAIGSRKTSTTGDKGMARKNETPEKVQIGVRLEEDLVDRLDAVAKKLSRPGLEITRADAIRVVLEAGLAAIEKEK